MESRNTGPLNSARTACFGERVWVCPRLSPIALRVGPAPASLPSAMLAVGERKRPVFKKRAGHSLIRQLIFERWDLTPLPAFDQLRNHPRVFVRNPSTFRLLSRAPKGHRQYAKPLSKRHSLRPATALHLNPPYTHSPNRRAGYLWNPGSAVNSSMLPESRGKARRSSHVVQLQSPFPFGNPYEYWLCFRSAINFRRKA